MQAEIVKMGWAIRYSLKQAMLLARAARLMTQGVGTSALGEVRPEGHCTDTGT